MIQNLNIQTITCGLQFLGKVDIGVTGLKSARWVVMGKNYPYRPQLYGLLKYKPNIHNGSGYPSLAQLSVFYDFIGIVQIKYPKFLMGQFPDKRLNVFKH